MYIIAQAEKPAPSKMSTTLTNSETQQNKMHMPEKIDPHPDPNKKEDKPRWRSKSREPNEQQKS